MGERRNKGPESALDKGLPAAVEVERLVLGASMVNDAHYLSAASLLTPDDFSLESHRRIFARMSELRGRGLGTDRVTVAQELIRNNELDSCGGLGYLVSLDDLMPAQVTSIDSYLAIVKEKAVLRRTIWAGQKLVNSALTGSRPGELQAAAEDILLALGEDAHDEGPQTPGEIIKATDGGLNTVCGPPQRGLTTGFHKFDEMTGGFHPDEFIILAARPSMGKTAMALNIAEYVAMKHGKTVAVFSLEMSKRALLDRLLCARANVDSQKKRMNYLNSEERHRLMRAAQELASAPLYIDDKSAATPADMHAKLRKLQAHRQVDLVIVDYLQLMSAGRTFENRNQEVTFLSRSMKLLAKEIGAPVVALSQLSRAPEVRRNNPRPQLSDLRESGSLEQDADLVAFIFREEVYKPTDGSLHGEAELILSKQRNGPVGTIRLVFIHNQTKFANRAEDIDEPAPLLNNSRGKDHAAGATHE